MQAAVNKLGNAGFGRNYGFIGYLLCLLGISRFQWRFDCVEGYAFQPIKNG